MPRAARPAADAGSRGVTRLAGAPARGNSAPRLTLRVDFGAHGALGPGKIRLLEKIDEQGSISAAGRAMGMSYRRAWLLVESLNQTFRAPLVESRHGGTGGGGAQLTADGREVVRRYRRLEAAAVSAAGAHLRALAAALSDQPPVPLPDDPDAG